jgi:hypothetical protein
MTENFQDSNLIFVGGAPRSGTTLVQRILACHSLVFGGPEFDFVPTLMRLRNDFHASVEGGRISPYLSHEDVDQVFRECVISTFKKTIVKNPGKIFFSEKTPSNAEVYPELSKTFPNAMLIFVARDPRAIVASMLEVGNRFKREKLRPDNFTRDVHRAVMYVNTITEVAYEQLSKNTRNFHVLYYEDFIISPTEAIQDLTKKLGLEFEEGMVEIEKKKTITAEFLGKEHLWYSRERLQSNIDSTSLEKWKCQLSDYQLFVISRRSRLFPGLTDRYDISSSKNLIYSIRDKVENAFILWGQYVANLGKRVYQRL